MSAWIVSRAHIDVLVQALCEGEYVTDRSPDEVGRELWRENLASVAYRYPNDGNGGRPGPMEFRDSDVDTYTYRRPSVRIEPSAVLSATGCYDYQSCEHPGWESSVSRVWVTMMDDALRAHPAVGDATGPWGFEESDVHTSAHSGVNR